jgi:RNA polymerase sigma-70 factor (ECF subfamily)
VKAAFMSAGLDLASLVKNHQAGVWRYLRALGCDPSEADELTQETFVAVLERPFEDYHPAATAAYLRTVARNLFLTARRKLARSGVVATDLVAGMPMAGKTARGIAGGDAADRGEGNGGEWESETGLDRLDADWSRWAARDNGETMLTALAECLNTLGDRARQALDLRFRDRQSRVQIATALGMSPDGAKNLLQRAKQQLRVCIEGKLE